MDEKITRERCEICGNHVPGFNTVYLSSEEKLTLVCLKCYNQRISDSTGFDYEHVEFEPIMIKDIDGVDHKFHFTVRLLGDRVAIDTFEIKDGHPGGYEFSVIGDIEKELFELFGKLFERIRQTLNRKHIYWSATTQKWKITDDDLSNTIVTLNEIKPKKVFLSGHDSCDHSLARMKQELKAETEVLNAGVTYRL